MSASPILGIPQVATNQNGKETTINTGMSVIESSLHEELVADFTAGGDITLNALQWTRHGLFTMTNVTAARNLLVPNTKRFFFVRNAGANAVTIGVSGAATGSQTLTVAAGKATPAYSDGTSVFSLMVA